LLVPHGVARRRRDEFERREQASCPKSHRPPRLQREKPLRSTMRRLAPSSPARTSVAPDKRTWTAPSAMSPSAAWSCNPTRSEL
ncbi:unnamed protein product, partial [Scytosiphon promiscuus]